MMSYLLLRNNNESGPFSLDQLVSMGLKPYDLVWVNGKSAAWRYPSEIAELKQFAPLVEEQPFDRFFKKPQESRNEEPVAAAQPVAEPAQPAYTPKKSVFVTMPGQKQQQAVKAEQPNYPEYRQYQPAAKEPVAEAIEPVGLTKTITITENPVSAEVKYSQPLDEIKQMYVKTLQERKQKIAYKAFLLQSARKVAVILGIVGVGVLIGFTIKSNSGKKQAAAAAIINPQTEIKPSLPAINDQPTDQTLITGDNNNEEQETVKHFNAPPAVNNELINAEPHERNTAATRDIENQPVETAPAKKNAATEQKRVAADEPSPGVNIDPGTGERTKKTRTTNNNEEATEPTTPVTQPKAVLSPGLSKMVSVTSNDYKRVAFGGIRGLELTVTNDSKYLLDNVTVELQYFKPSEDPLKTDNIQFRSISPGGSLTIRVPDTNRGIKIAYRITHILSTQSAKAAVAADL